MSVTLNSDLFILGNFTISGDDFDANGYNVEITGNFNFTSTGTLLGGSGIWTIGGDCNITNGISNLEDGNWEVGGSLSLVGTDFTGNLTDFIISGNTGNINFNGETIKNITIEASGTKTQTGNIIGSTFYLRTGTWNANAKNITSTNFYVDKNSTLTGLAGSAIVSTGLFRIFGNSSVLNPASPWSINAVNAPRIGGTTVANLTASGSQITVFNSINGGSNTNLLFVNGVGTGGIAVGGASIASKLIVVRPTGGIVLSNNLNPAVTEVTIYPSWDFVWSLPAVLQIDWDFVWNQGTPPLSWYRIEGKCIAPNCQNSGVKTPGAANTVDEIVTQIQTTEDLPLPKWPKNPSFEDWSSGGQKSEKGFLYLDTQNSISPFQPDYWYTSVNFQTTAAATKSLLSTKDTTTGNFVHGESSLKIEVTGDPIFSRSSRSPSTGILSKPVWININGVIWADPFFLWDGYQPGQDINFTFFAKCKTKVNPLPKLYVQVNGSNYGIINSPGAINDILGPNGVVYNNASYINPNSSKTYSYKFDLPPSQDFSMFTVKVKGGTQYKYIYMNIAWSLDQQIVKVDGSELGFYYNFDKGDAIWFDAFNIAVENPPATPAGDPTVGCGTSASKMVMARGIADLCYKLSNPSMSAPFKGPIKSIIRYSRPVYRDSIYSQGVDACNIMIEEEFITIPECLKYAVDEDLYDIWGAYSTVKDTFLQYMPSGGIVILGSADCQIVPKPVPQPSGGLTISGEAECYAVINGVVTYFFNGNGVINIAGSSTATRSRGYYVHVSEGGITVTGEVDSNRTSSFFAFQASGGVSVGGDARERVIYSHTPQFPFIFVRGSADAYKTNYKYTEPSGGINVSGVSPVFSSRVYVATGGINVSGVAKTYSSHYSYMPDGGINMSGYARISRYFSADGGVSLGGEAVLGFQNTFESSGGVSIGGESLFFSPYYSYKPTGGIVLGGDAIERSSNLGDFFMGSSGGFMNEVFLQPVFGITPAPDYVFPTTNTAIPCSNTNVNLILNVYHNLQSTNYLTTFLSRNRFKLPSQFKLNYRSQNNSWRNNFHFTGLTEDNVTKERWDILYELSCTDNFGGDSLGTSVWKTQILFKRRNLTTKQDADTKLLFLYPATAVFSDDGNVVTSTGLTNARLDVTFNIDTTNGSIITSNGAVSQDVIVYDGIGLFNSSYWKKNPIYVVSMTEFAPASATPTADISSIIPANV